jgi:hypothetical protein
MPITFNGTNITSIVFNGSTMNTVVFNGTTVFTTAPAETQYYTNGTQNVAWTTGSSSGTDGSVSISSPYITIAAGYSGFNTTTNERTARTTNTVNLSGITTLYVELDTAVRGLGSQSIFHLIASTSSTASFSTFNARTSLTNQFATGSTTTISLDVSALSGSYFIRLHQRDGSTSSAQGAITYVRRVWGV